MRVLAFSLFLSLFSCGPSDGELLRYSRECTLHDNSSKIWVVNKVLKRGKNYTKMLLHEKDAAIFFKNGNVAFQPMNTLGHLPKEYGKMFMNENDSTLLIAWDKENWSFVIQEMSAQKVILKHDKSSAFKYDLVLITYPQKP